MKQAAAYLRVSPSESKANETIDNQRAFLQRYCQTQNIAMLRRYEDDQVSGDTPMDLRPSGFRMLRDAAEGRFDALLVYRIDRLGRNTLDSLQIARKLKEYGVGIVSMTEPFDTSGPTGEFVFTLLAAVAQMERKTILARTALGKVQAANNGRWNGGRAPYGYVVTDRRLEIDPPAAAVVLRIFLMYSEGSSLSDIGNILTAERIPSPAGGAWNKTCLSKLLQNRVYIGEGSFRKWEVVRENGRSARIEAAPEHARIGYEVPAIVEDELFEAAQRTRARNPLSAKRSRRYDYVLAGLVSCERCGGVLQGHTDASRGKLYPYYRCSGTMTKVCRLPMVPAAQIEAGVWARIALLAENPGDAINKLRVQTRDYLQTEDEVAGLQTALVSKEQERERILSLFRRAIITETDLERQFQGIAAETAALTERLETLQKRQGTQFTMRARLSAAEETILALKQNVHDPSPEAKQRMINTLVDRVFISHDGNEHRIQCLLRFDLDVSSVNNALTILTEVRCLRR